MADHLLGDQHIFEGWWYVASDTATLLPGRLSWTARGASLQLFDALTPLVEGPIFGTEQYSYPAIHGVDIKGGLISVLDGVSGGPAINFGPAGLHRPEHIVSSLVVVGAHLTTSTLMSELSVRLPDAVYWYLPKGVSVQFVESNDRRWAHYLVEPVADEVIDVPSAKVRLAFVVLRTQSPDLTADLRVKTSIYVRIQPYEPQSLSILLDQFRVAASLLALLIGRPVHADHARIRVPGIKHPAELLTGMPDGGDASRAARSYDIFLARDALSASMGDVVSRWFERYAAIGTPAKLALDVLSSRDLWPHVEFLSLMHALEGFHRATASMKIRLRQRLDELLGMLGPEIAAHLVGGDDALLQKWVATRNYYTHWHGPADNILDGPELYYSICRLRLMLRCVYLAHAGVPLDLIAGALRNASSECQRLLRINALEYRRQHPGSEVGTLMRYTTKKADVQADSASLKPDVGSCEPASN